MSGARERADRQQRSADGSVIQKVMTTYVNGDEGMVITEVTDVSGTVNVTYLAFNLWGDGKANYFVLSKEQVVLLWHKLADFTGLLDQ